MSYIQLTIAIVIEIEGISRLKIQDGFTRLDLSIIVIKGYKIAF